MPKEQILMGIVIAVLCGTGLWYERWFLANTRKGRRLLEWFGERKALWLLRALLGLGIAFGILLAVDVIRPVRW